MRDTIRALSRAKTNRVTIFLTSHNLAEVEELCDRIGIISKGCIQAVGTPRNLRTSHTANEQVSIIFRSDSPSDIENALRATFTDHFLTLAPGDQESTWRLSLSRSDGDDSLDRALRVVQRFGGVIRSVETESASLLDVLESYEQPDRVKETQS
jgi:ABC-2 type transport system ATP-binding protein